MTQLNYSDILNKKNKFINLVEFSNFIDPSTNYFNKNTTEFLTYCEKNDQKLKPDSRVTYKLNNFAHRSEDFFTLDQNKNNILFTGCSSTFGIGLPEKYIWSKILYNNLPLNNKGPFQSIGIPGAGAERLISNIFKYCREFGNPKYIFIAFQDYTREMIYEENENGGKFKDHIHLNYRTSKMDVTSNYDISLIFQFQNLYRMLETYCKSHNIILLSTSWDSITKTIMSELFTKSFTQNSIHFHEYVKNFNIDSIIKSDMDFLSAARDGHHPGIVSQNFISDSFLLGLT